MNIYEKMSAITAEISAVAKNLAVGYGQSSYKAVGEADVLAAVKPIEEKYKIYSYPLDREIVGEAVLENEVADKQGNKSIKKNLFMRIRTTYRFVNIENPEEYIDMVAYGDGVDPQDKAPGKAMTYADKYCLLKAFKIITGDDPDQHYSGDLKSAKKAQPSQDVEVAKIDQVKIHSLMAKANEAGVSQEKLLETAKVASFTDITLDVYMSLMKKLDATIKAKAKENK